MKKIAVFQYVNMALTVGLIFLGLIQKELSAVLAWTIVLGYEYGVFKSGIQKEKTKKLEVKASDFIEALKQVPPDTICKLSYKEPI